MAEINREPLPVYFSSMNVGLSSFALKPVSWLGNFVWEAGLDGVQLAPSFTWLYGHTPTAVQYAVRAGDLSIGGVHASVRGSENATPADKTGYRPAGLMGKAVKLLLDGPTGPLIMPGTVQSATYLNQIQNVIGRRVPGTFFPQSDPKRDRKQIETAAAEKSLVQLKDDAAGAVGAKTPDGFIERIMKMRGYDGFVFDTGHTPNRQPFGAGVVSDVDNFADYVPYVRGVDLSLNRTDLGGEVAEVTARVGRRLLAGKGFDGELAERLAAVRDFGQVDFVNLETTFVGMRGMLPERFHNLPSFRNAYGYMADVVCDFFGRPRLDSGTSA